MNLLSKNYPTDYPTDAVTILNTMSMGGELVLVGSMALRSQKYAGDYDGYETVALKGAVGTALTTLRKRFQKMVEAVKKLPNAVIGDIKAGIVPMWRVIPRSAVVKEERVVGYDATTSRKKVDELLKAGIITDTEAEKARHLLLSNPTPCEFLLAKKEIKFHVLRWTPCDVFANHKKMRDGKSITLEEAFHTDGITKVDVFGLVGDLYKDFSVIYEFRVNGKVLNQEPIEITTSLRESLMGYICEGNFFKALKRMFALAKYHDDAPLIDRLTAILNSELGRIYVAITGIDTMLGLMEQMELEDPITKELMTLREELNDKLQKASKPFLRLKGGEIPSQYLADLTEGQKKRQTALIEKSKEDYKRGKVEDRPAVSDTPTKRSPHVIRFEKKYGFPITDKKRLKETFPDTDIEGILSKGAGAYGSSGSRPNVSIAQWSYARLASVLTGSKALRVDKGLVGSVSMKKINKD